MLGMLEWTYEWVAYPEAWIGLLTLTALEIVLGIDNIVFISILAGKLPPEQQPKARRYGLLAAMGARILLLFSISWVMQLEDKLFSVLGHGVSGKDLILILGGLFLLGKSTYEIHERLEGESHHQAKVKAVSFAAVITQILLLDMVFSIDSVITAVGMVQWLGVMILAVVIAVGVMMAFAEVTARFVEKHPTVKMLALSFLLLIGFSLVVEGVHVHIPKGYIYFAMGFSIFVEMLNLKIRGRSKTPPVKLHGQPDVAKESPAT